MMLNYASENVNYFTVLCRFLSVYVNIYVYFMFTLATYVMKTLLISRANAKFKPVATHRHFASF